MSGVDLIRRMDDGPGEWAALRPSDFVEFRGVFSPNPLAHAIRMFLRLVDLANKVGPQTQIALATGHAARQNTSTTKSSRASTSSRKQETGAPTAIFEDFLADLEQGQAQMLVIEPSLETPYTVVTTINSEHLRDGSLQELLDGEYRLLGQVTRHLKEGTPKSVNLLRGSAFGVLAEEQVDQTVKTLNMRLEAEGWRLPPPTTIVKSPAIQVLPIAIYP